MTSKMPFVGVPALAGSLCEDRQKTEHEQKYTLQRFGRMAMLLPGAEEEYDRLHAAVWPEVLEAIRRAGIRNYSIFRQGHWLFSYCEITGEVDFAEAERSMLDNPACRRWEAVVQPLQESSGADIGKAAWVPMKEVFHLL